MKYAGLLGSISEAVDIQAEQGVTADEAFQIQRERDQRRRQERDEAQNTFTEDPMVIAAKVGRQMGISTADAIDQMVCFDSEAMCNFRIGNDIDRKELN